MQKLIFLALVLLANAANAQQIPRQQALAVRNACQSDVQRLCRGVEPGGGRLVQCLEQNAPAVSEICLIKLKELQAARAQLQ